MSIWKIFLFLNYKNRKKLNKNQKIENDKKRKVKKLAGFKRNVKSL